MTNEEAAQCNVSDEIIIEDMIDTQREIDDFEAALKVLRKNPVENKLEIYLKEGKILKRKEFINKLNFIQEFRKQNIELNKTKL